MASAHKRTGTIARIPGPGPVRYRARIRLADGSRPWIKVPDGYSEARAREFAAAMQEREDAQGLLLAKKRREAKSADPERETAAEWFDRYLTWRETRGFVTSGDVAARLRRYAVPHFEGKGMRAITRDDIEAIVAGLDERVELASEGGDLRFSWKTAANVWGDVTRAFDEACHSKDRSLRVLDVDPTTGVRGPERGDDRTKPILYPDELTRLVSCAAVPLYRRRVYVLAVYLAARSNEIAALTARDVDFEHGRFHVTKQVDRKTKEARPTKTRRTRSPDIEAELVPLLRALTEAAPTGRLVHMPPDEDRSELLRKDLATAGVAREDLMADDELRAPITFHNLRDTGLTWMAIRGDDPLRIQWRAGHTQFATTQGYIAQAKRLAVGFGAVFPPVPEELHPPGSWSTSRSISAPVTSQVTEVTDSILATPTGIEPVLPT